VDKRTFTNRLVVLDTETTGLNPQEGHRIIEIGCVELVNRRLTGKRFHTYINPERIIDDGAIEVHGITNQFLEDKPCFADVVKDFIAFIQGAELVIHNAPFDVGFINYEFSRLNSQTGTVTDYSKVFDTLTYARKNILDSVIVWMRCVNVTGSITATGICMAHCWMPRFWPMCFY